MASENYHPTLYRFTLPPRDTTLLCSALPDHLIIHALKGLRLLAIARG